MAAFGVTLLSVGGALAAADVPLPKPRPAETAPPPGPPLKPHDLPFGDISPGPSACDRRLAELAEFAALPGLIGPGECGAAEAVRLDAVMLGDRTRVPLNPPAVLRCSMAEALSHFMREEVAPAASAVLGSPLAAIVNYDSYSCRGRNRVAGARLSEHGKGNAIDIRAIRLGDGSVVELTSPVVAKDFRERVRLAACERFRTVLGPGSDGYHENHVHFDLAERARGYKLCQWDVREPPVAVEVPLPLPRPSALAEGGPAEQRRE